MAAASDEGWNGGRLTEDRVAHAIPAIPPAASGSTAIGQGWSALFLSLMLMILAFFVVLVSISQIDAVRSVGVMGSVAETFAASDSWGAARKPSGAARGDVVDGSDLEQSLRALFATELEMAPTSADLAGRVAALTFDAEALFIAGHATVREAAEPLLDRIAAATTDRPEGLGVQLDIVVGVMAAFPVLGVDTDSLAVRRGSALAEALALRGLPRAWMAVGLRPGRTDQIVLAFAPRLSGQPGQSARRPIGPAEPGR